MQLKWGKINTDHDYVFKRELLIVAIALISIRNVFLRIAIYHTSGLIISIRNRGRIDGLRHTCGR